MKLKTAFLVLTAMLGTAVAAEPARALTITSTLNSPTGFLPRSTVIDFDSSPLLPPGVTLTGGKVFADSVGGTAARPFGATGNFFSVGLANTTPGRGQGPATLRLSRLATYFGMYWGSVDTYNSLRFFRDGTLIRTVTGSQVIAAAVGNQGIDGSTYVNFVADDASEYFDTVVLQSGGFAFESDNFAFREIPTPALVPAAIGFGAAMLRKRKQEEKDSAEANG